jgi:DNA-directed RNA polymerase II subunit RPB11
MSELDGATAPSWNRKIGTLVEHEPNCGLRDGQRNNHHVSHKADGPANRFELFLLDDGQSKVEHKEETRKHPAVPLHVQLLTLAHNRRP